MADPFSIVAGTVGLLDVCWRVGSYLNSVKIAAGKIEGDIDALQKEVTSLIDVNESIKKLKDMTEEADPSSSINHSPGAENLWQSVDSNTEGCKVVVLRLEEKVKDIMGKSGTARPTSKIDGIKKTLKREATDPDLVKIHNSLSKYQLSLQTLLTALNMSVLVSTISLHGCAHSPHRYYTRSSHKTTGNAIGNLSNRTDRLSKLESKLDYQLDVLRSRTSSVGDDGVSPLSFLIRVNVIRTCVAS